MEGLLHLCVFACVEGFLISLRNLFLFADGADKGVSPLHERIKLVPSYTF